MRTRTVFFPAALVLFLLNPLLQAQDTISRSSGNSGAAYLAENAFDGDESSRWISKKNEQTAWLLYDFHKSVSIEHIIINWENSSAKEFCIQSSENGEDWNTVYDEKNGNGGITSLHDLEFQGRFFRILSINKDPDLCYSIWDIEFPDPEPSKIIELRKREIEKKNKAKLKEITEQTAASCSGTSPRSGSRSHRRSQPQTWSQQQHQWRRSRHRARQRHTRRYRRCCCWTR